MCMFILECFGNYIKSVTDCVMSTICVLSNIIGITLYYMENINDVQLIDNNITWIEARYTI